MSDLILKQLMKLRQYLFVLILSFIFVGCSKAQEKISDDNRVVAEIGKDYKVTLADLNKYIEDWQYNRKYRDRSEIYNNALKDLVNNQLKRFDFFERKLNENSELMSEVRPALNNQIINVFFDEVFVAKYVNDSTAAKAYKEMDKEIIINEIVLPISENPSVHKLDSLKTLALDIEQRIKNNNNIDKLIKENSIINSVKNVTWLQSMNDPIAYVSFQLQIGSTQVIQTYDGIHIIKAIDIKKIKLEPFEDIKEKIFSDLKQGYNQVYSKEYADFRSELIDYSSIKWNEPSLKQIVEWSNTHEFFGGAYKDTMQNAISSGNNFEILSYNKGIVDLKEFLRLLNEVVILNPNIQLNSKSVKEFITDAIYDANVVTAAKKNGLEEKMISPYSDNLVIKSKLSYLYNKEIIEGSIPEATPEALKKFYDDQKDSIFYQLKKINIYTRIYSDSNKAAEEINVINNGTPFEKVSDRWFVKTFIRERDGTLNSFRSQEPPYLAEAAFKLELNEVDGPIKFKDDEKGVQFAVIKAIHIQPEKQLTYDEVQGKRIDEEFKDFYRQKITDEVNSTLRRKYNVKVFEDVLSQAVVAK